jgi:hypothetical protein
VLYGGDGGEGGSFALYSFICRHVRVGLLPGDGTRDELMEEEKATGRHGERPVSRDRAVLEKYRVLQRLLLLFTVLRTCMVIGDGVLTRQSQVGPLVTVLVLDGWSQSTSPVASRPSRMSASARFSTTPINTPIPGSRRRTSRPDPDPDTGPRAPSPLTTPRGTQLHFQSPHKPPQKTPPTANVHAALAQQPTLVLPDAPH